MPDHCTLRRAVHLLTPACWDCFAALKRVWVVALQIRARLRAGRPVHPLTMDFWNSLTGR
jgi:hypothetical protein